MPTVPAPVMAMAMRKDGVNARSKGRAGSFMYISITMRT